MKLGSLNMCDFCFEPIKDGSKCHKCGLSHETYKPSPGLLKPGANLMGKYIIGRALGRGGFGATYIAYSNDHAKAVAVKEYLPVSISYRSTGEETVAIVSEDNVNLPCVADGNAVSVLCNHNATDVERFRAELLLD